MAIGQGIWRLGDQPKKLQSSGMADESVLEDMIMKDVSILNPDWLLLGRQVRTQFDKYIDLLAMDANGSVIIIELKRDRTPRAVVAQVIDYASWVRTLDDSDIAEIYRDFAERYNQPYQTIDDAFQATFGIVPTGDLINSAHQMVVVATELDASTERIIGYLNEVAQISVNALFFNIFKDNGSKYLSRAWMIDPEINDEKVVGRTAKGSWNGQYYASFGFDRPWEDARRLGFIVAGGAAWYSKTLDMLSPGDYVWVNMPGEGYVGVGIVTGERKRADNYQFDTPDGPKSLQHLPLDEPYDLLDLNADDEHAEYLVPVDWIHTVPRSQAFKEVGLFGNQNTVCKPSSSKWDHTIRRLKEVWPVSEMNHQRP